MHQSCIVKNKAGFWTLLTLGGRCRDQSGQDSWTNSVEAIDLVPYFRTGTDKVSEWSYVKPMQSARANFSA